MKVLTFAQRKGGVGKTTLALHVAVEAMAEGLRVAVLDFDVWGTAMRWSQRRDAPPPVRFTSIERLSKNAPENRLDDDLARLAEAGVDLVVIDTPATALIAGGGMGRSDLIVIPCRPGAVDVEASGDTARAAHRIGRRHVYVMTLAEGGAQAIRAAEMVAALSAVGHQVWSRAIGRRPVYADAIADGLVAREMPANRHGLAVEEIAALWRWIKKTMENSK